jgi:hypothetical protein
MSANIYQSKLLKSLNSFILIGSFAFILFSLGFGTLSSVIRYVKYLPILFLVLTPLVFSQKRNLMWFELLIVGGIVSVLIVPDKYGLEDLVFLVAAIVPFLLTKNIKSSQLDTLFYMTIGSLLCQVLVERARFQFYFSFKFSETFFESGLSFIFGFYFLYYLIEKNYVKTLFALLLMLFTMKRIALLGVGVLIPFCLWRDKPLKPILLILINAIPILTIVSIITNNNVVAFFEETFGLNIHQLTLGRFTLWHDAATHVERNPFIGQGWGTTYLSPVDEDGPYLIYKYNLHSDVLKVLAEFGLPFFLVFFYLFYFIKNIKVQIFYIYFNILMFTDNVLIYTDILVFLFLFSEYYTTQSDTALIDMEEYPNEAVEQYSLE